MRLRALLGRHPSAAFWGLLAGYTVVFPEAWFALLPHGAVRSTIFIVGSSVSLVPGIILWTDAGESVQLLREEFRRRGYSGRPVEWPNAFWQTVGFGLCCLGAGALLGGLTS
jgi:hypothetical protein